MGLVILNDFVWLVFGGVLWEQVLRDRVIPRVHSFSAAIVRIEPSGPAVTVTVWARGRRCTETVLGGFAEGQEHAHQLIHRMHGGADA